MPAILDNVIYARMLWALHLHQGEEVPAQGGADLGEALDGVDDDKDLNDEDRNTVEDLYALEPLDSSEREWQRDYGHS